LYVKYVGRMKVKHLQYTSSYTYTTYNGYTEEQRKDDHTTR